ncbi:MAG: hypothetical protein AAGD92_04380 [Pseudomonadota bacterium]
MLSDVSELFEATPSPVSTDRRIARRLIDVWARAARGRFPSWEDLQETDLGEDLDWLFVIDCEKSVGFPYFVFLGDRIAKLSDVFLCGANDWSLSLLDKATGDIFSAVATEAPHFREEALALCDGRRVMMRSVTAPLADDGETITHVVGVVSGRFAQTEGLNAVL